MMPGFSMYKHIFKHHGHFPQMDDELLLSKSIQWFLYNKTEQADGTWLQLQLWFRNKRFQSHSSDELLDN